MLISTPWPFRLRQSRLSFLHSSEWRSSQKCMHRHEGTCTSYAAIRSARAFLLYCLGSSVTQPQAVIEPLGSNSGVASATSSGGAHAGYQMYQRPFSSSSGSGYTIWYSSRSDSSIQSPPVIPQSKTGHLYVHFDALTKTYQYWMLGVGGQWESVTKNAECPHNHDRVLSIRSNGEPSWVTRATISTTETRREKGAKS